MCHIFVVAQAEASQSDLHPNKFFCVQYSHMHVCGDVVGGLITEVNREGSNKEWPFLGQNSIRLWHTVACLL